MSSFEEREKAFEAKFRQDQERDFKVQARRNFLFGKWAAAVSRKWWKFEDGVISG